MPPGLGRPGVRLGAHLSERLFNSVAASHVALPCVRCVLLGHRQQVPPPLLIRFQLRLVGLGALQLVLQLLRLPVAPAVELMHEHRRHVLKPKVDTMRHSLGHISAEEHALLQDRPRAEAEEQRQLCLGQVLDLVDVQQMDGPLEVPLNQPLAVHMVHNIQMVIHSVDLLEPFICLEKAVHALAVLTGHAHLLPLEVQILVLREVPVRGHQCPVGAFDVAHDLNERLLGTELPTQGHRQLFDDFLPYNGKENGGEHLPQLTGWQRDPCIGLRQEVEQPEAWGPICRPREELCLQLSLHHHQQLAVRDEERVGSLAEWAWHLSTGARSVRCWDVRSRRQIGEVALDLRAQCGGLGEEHHVGHGVVGDPAPDLTGLNVPIQHGVDATQRLSGARPALQQDKLCPGTADDGTLLLGHLNAEPL
mmetsp:Transcript_3614/g.6260  ORF Transcript_3614/g.6260 Transcript_3614/m.6260 type:complete len:420 (+) Transcript_3614:6114-7373(+)